MLEMMIIMCATKIPVPVLILIPPLKHGSLTGAPSELCVNSVFAAAKPAVSDD